MWRAAGSRIRLEWISSAKTTVPWRADSAATASSSAASNTRPTGFHGWHRINSPAPSAMAAPMASRSRVQRGRPSAPAARRAGTCRHWRPCRAGMDRNGMYAGVGTITGEPGRVWWAMIECRADRTSGRSETAPASTSQPSCSRWWVATASRTRRARSTGMYPRRPSSTARCSAAPTTGAVPRSISATQAAMTSPGWRVHLSEPRRRICWAVRASHAAASASGESSAESSAGSSGREGRARITGRV